MKRFLVLLILCGIGFGMAVPAVNAQSGGRTVITTANAGQLSSAMRLGRGIPTEAVFSPDDQIIAVGTSIGVWLYDATDLATETEPALLETGSEVGAMVFSADGSVLFVAGDEGVQVWDAASQNLVTNFDTSYGTGSMALSPDESVLALNLGYSGITLWGIADNAELAKYEGQYNASSDIIFNSDGSSMAIAGTDYKVYLLDPLSGEASAELAGHSNSVNSIVFSPDDSVVASGSADKTVRLWDTSGTELATLAPSDEEVDMNNITSLAFSPDGSVLASGHYGGQLFLWDVAGQSEITLIDTTTSDVSDINFSHDGSVIVTVGADQAVQLWDAASGELLAAAVGHYDAIDAMAFSPDSNTLAISNFDEYLWMWDTNTMLELTQTLVIEEGASLGGDNVTNVTFSHDGSVVAATDSFDIVLWNPATGEELARLEGDGITEALAFSPDDTLLAYVSSSGLYVFDVANATLLASLEVQTDWMTGVAFSPDQTMLASANRDGTVRIWTVGE